MDREPVTPLLIGFTLAVAAHLGAAGGFGVLARQADVTPPPPRPDLAVEHLEIGSPRLVNQPTPITLGITNHGPAPTGVFTVELSAGDQLIEQIALPRGLAAGASTQLTFAWTAPRPGGHRIVASVDPAGEIDESDETNNEHIAIAAWAGEAKGGTPGLPDLAVFDVSVAEPRIARIAAGAVARFANLGPVPTQPTRYLLMVDGSQHGDIIHVPALEPGTVFEHGRDLIVNTPGIHEIRAVPMSGGSLGDGNPGNDEFIARLNWLEHDPLKPGQDAPSKVTINWISERDFQDLIARRARFDQATAQQETTPTEVMQTPVDPTPPAPAPSVAQVAPPLPQSAASPALPQRVMDKPDKPDQPTQPTPPQPELPPAPTLTIAPMLPDVPAEEASAPKQDDPTKPTMIKPAGTPPPGSPPQPVVDDTPSTDPKPAPPVPAPPSSEVAIATPKVQSMAGDNPLLPRSVDLPNDTPDKTAMRAPAVEPSPDARPTDATRGVEAPPAHTPALAALPLPARPDAPAGAPPALNQPDSANDRKTQVPTRPVDPQKPAADGESPDKAQMTGSPNQQASPQTTAPPSNPTAAPQQPREAPPVSRIEGELRPGAVLARHGVEIRTIRPRFSTVALRSSLPSNPTVEVVFDRSGQAIDAKFLKTTGYANIDGPILTSLYRWTATGENLKKLTGNLTVEIRILLNDLED